MTPITFVGLAALIGFPAEAGEVQWGEVHGSFDTTIAAGVAIRTEDADDSNVCTALGGSGADCGRSDGNLNYEQGRPTSTALQATHELDLRWRNYGLFGRVNYFYDAESHDGSRSHVPLSATARKESGADFELLDGYVSAELHPFELPLTLRVGEQVISWGESTFLPNGINVINPVDVGRLRVPGAELREALLPIPAAHVTLGLTENVSVEAFWQWGWRETQLDPPGTFFSTSDGLGPGGEIFDISLGHNDCSTNRVFFGQRTDGTLGAGCVLRGSDVKPDHENQWGLAARVLLPWLNGAELGLFAIDYHSRLPYASGFFGESRDAAVAALIAAGADPSSPSFPLAVANRVVSQFRIQQEYPEHIRRYGVSLSTTVESLDLAVQGEISWSPNLPLQLSEQQGVRSFFAASGLQPPSFVLPGVRLGAQGEFVSAAIEHRVYTGQVTFTKLIEPGRIVGGVLGANQLALVAETGFIRVRGLESSAFRPLQGAVTPTSIATGATADLDASFASSFSWGAVAVARLTYNDAFFGWNLEPSIAYQHDLNGTSPAPIGNFIEDRKGVTLGLRGEYLNRWAVNLVYASFLGAGKENPLRDRDFVSFSVQYSF